MLLKSIPLLVFTIFAFVHSIAQSKHKYFVTLASGYVFQQGRDNGMSPLIYSGNHYAGLIGFEKRKDVSINRFNVSGTAGVMSNRTQPKNNRSDISSYRLQLDYCYLHQIKHWNAQKLLLYAGGAWNNLIALRIHQRYVNNDINYDFSSSLGATFSLLYSFNLKKRTFLLNSEITFPFVAFNIRPSFASSIPDGFINQKGSNIKAFFHSGMIQSFGGFFRLRNAYTLEYVLFNDNRLMLGYTWDYYCIKKYYKSQAGVHFLLLGLLFRF